VIEADDNEIHIISVKKQRNYNTGAEFRLQKNGKPITLTTGWNKLIVSYDILSAEIQILLGA